MTAEQVREEELRRANARVLECVGALAKTGPLTRIGAALAQQLPRHSEVRASEANELELNRDPAKRCRACVNCTGSAREPHGLIA